MLEKVQLIKGSGLVDLVADVSLNKGEYFLHDENTNVDLLNKSDLVIHIACSLVKKYSLRNLLVGIEIKIPSRSRELRIPMVTIERNGLIIWKACFSLSDLDKVSLVLNEIEEILSGVDTLNFDVVQKFVIFPTRLILNPSDKNYLVTKCKNNNLKYIFADELLARIKICDYFDEAVLTDAFA